MTIVLEWIKTNLITVISVFVALVGLGMVGYVFFVADAALIDNIAEMEQPINDIEGVMRTRIEVPTSNPAQPTEQVTRVVTPAVIEDMRRRYSLLDQKFQAIVQRVSEMNARGHLQFLDTRRGDNADLFPDVQDFQRFTARNQYRSDLLALLLSPGAPRPAELPAPGEHLPFLNAGMPPADEDVQSQVLAVEEEFGALGGLTQQEMSQLSAIDRRQLQQDKQRRLMEVLAERARDIHIYAETDPRSGQFPLTTAPWALAEDRPTDAQLWEAQMELWIQQDIVEAIMRANQVNDAENPRRVNAQTNVLSAPVKRLIQMVVQPGYVGLQHHGLLAGDSRSGGGGSFRNAGGSAGSAAPEGPAPPPRMHDDPNARPSDDFFAGPSGRVSNGLYDVRHVALTLHVDWNQLPAFLEQLSRVNLMTVLDMDLRSVDEYELLQGYYLYGTRDVVEVDMVVETLWLRPWREPLMPERVKQYLGIIPPPEGSQPGFGGPGGFGGPRGAGFDY